MIYQLRKEDKNLIGHIALTGSKSISNRALIIRALSGLDFPIHRLASAKDTVTLEALLASSSEVLDTGAAGTTYRFMTAYLASQPGSRVLTGSERMKERPIGVLVDALRKLGANISYLEKEGYPPLRIDSPSDFGAEGKLTISASTSSQYISALLMLAPTLARGLELQLEGKVVSRPYIHMTLGLMQHFGVEHQWVDNTIYVKPQAYQARAFNVEADWSAASYYYAMAAFADQVDLQLDGLFANSFQGDAALVEQYAQLGINSTFNETGLHLSKLDQPLPSVFEYDFLECPDVAQTLAVTCAGLGIQGLFSGLETLRIKETDRIAALQNELAKVSAFLSPLPARFNKKQADKNYFLLEGKAVIVEPPIFATYEDHRMAMAFAPLAQFGTIQIEEPMVVVKSYPDFYKDMQQLGFQVEELS